MLETHKSLYALGAIASVALIAALFIGAYSTRGAFSTQPALPTGAQGDGYIAPPPSPEIAAMVERSRGFDTLVSYTDRGFEPSLAKIKKGQTVRFTNNSSGDLWIISDATGVGTANAIHLSSCEEGALGTCGILKPGEFWEFTFEKAGTWQYGAARATGEGFIQVQ